MSLSGWVLLAYIAAVSFPLAVIDLREHRLPNRLVVPGMALAVTLGLTQVVATNASPMPADRSYWAPLICGVGAFAVFLVLALLGGMGMGDVKLAAVLGAAAGFLGWEVALAALMSAFLLGGLGALTQKGINRIRRKPHTSHIPFGPYMLAGFWVCAAFALFSA
jgi:leader peptidase (prepilin peptidase)/N-methyltransferase